MKAAEFRFKGVEVMTGLGVEKGLGFTLRIAGVTGGKRNPGEEKALDLPAAASNGVEEMSSSSKSQANVSSDSKNP